MKIRNLCLWGCLFMVGHVIAQTPQTSTNYIIKTNYKESGITTLNDIETLTNEQKTVSVDYFDGLGRPIQSVVWQASTAENDILLPKEYDAMGRNSKNYLPYTRLSGNGAYDPLAIKGSASGYTTSNQYLFYQAKTGTAQDAYSVTIFEKSALGKELERGAAGATWQPVMVNGVSDETGHTIKIENEGNTATEVRLFGVSGDQPEDIGYYASQTLQKNIIKDENWIPNQTGKLALLHTTEIFKDNTGKLILKRMYVEDGNDTDTDPDVLETYYVYDEFELLRFIMPPEVVRRMYSEANSLTGNYRVVNQAESLASPETDINSYIVTTTGSLTLTNGFTIAPAAGNPYIIISGDVSKDMMYSYKYDTYKRLIEKTLPGSAPIYIVYDKRDRVVAIQDGENRKKGEWMFSKYDAFNRPIITGILNNGITSQNEMQEVVNTFYLEPTTNQYFEEQSVAVGSLLGYTNDKSFPVDIISVNCLTVTYYDKYDWMNCDVPTYYTELAAAFATHGFTGVTVPAITRSTSVRGLVTGTMVKVLDGNNTWLQSVVFYDDHYRPILARSENYVGGEDIVLTKYNFVGGIDESWLCHKNNITTPGTRFIRQINQYDHVSRLISTKQQMTGATTLVTIAKMEYNEVGQLIKKYVGGDTETNCAQAMDYVYNIRGWLSQINNPGIAAADKRKFAMRLNYTSQVAGLTSPSQYNGNISGVEWRTPANTVIGSPSDMQAYGYTYDATNRLTGADYGQGVNGTVAADAYNLTIDGYDLNGNILGLARRQNSNGQIDKLTYSYLGNQLLSVSDAATGTKSLGFNDGNAGSDYSYDSNGNLTTDKNKGIRTIEYNYLGLVSKVTGTDNKTIEFIYNAKGVKLAKKVSGGANIYYSGAFVYEGSTLDYILHAEGQYVLSGATGEYQYNIKDYLGNVRLVVNQAGIEKQQSAFDPLGMQYLAGGSSDNKYLYKGAELQDDYIGIGLLGWSDLGARMYDSQLGRFFTTDPLAEENHILSPYSYAANNPISYIDVNGLIPVWCPSREEPNGNGGTRIFPGHWEDDNGEFMTFQQVIDYYALEYKLSSYETLVSISTNSDGVAPDLNFDYNKTVDCYTSSDGLVRSYIIYAGLSGFATMEWAVKQKVYFTTKDGMLGFKTEWVVKKSITTRYGDNPSPLKSIDAESVVATKKVNYAKSGDGEAKAGLISVNLDYNSKFAGWNIGLNVAQVSAFNITKEQDQVNIGASAVVFNQAFDARLGTANFNVNGGVNGVFLKADAKLKFGLYHGTNKGDSKLGFSGAAEAGAYTASGELKYGLNIAGWKLNVSMGGSAASAHIGGGFDSYFDVKSGYLNLSGFEHIGLGIGESSSLRLEIPILWMFKK